eukprot:Amastigsp_a842246_59.p1 type:complete len:376 gc:universal Amastigsp_a842246_59:81-1208(+)
MPWLKKRVYPEGKFPHSPPSLLSFWLREHLVLGIFFPNPLYPNQARMLGRASRIYMLALVFLLAFLGSLVAQAFVLSVPRCSGAAFCLSACRSDAGLSTRPSGSAFTPCALTNFRPQAFNSRLNLRFFSYPHPDGVSAARFSWCAAAGLNPPLCLPLCRNNTERADGRPLCAEIPAPDRSSLVCVAPESIARCGRTGAASDLLCNEAVSSCAGSRSTLQAAMRADARTNETPLASLLIVIAIAIAIFVLSWVIRQILRFVTKSGRCCCSALVIKSIGCLIILAVLVLVILLSVGISQALRGAGWLTSIRRFASSFAISLALDFAKLAFFYYVFPRYRNAYTAAYNELRDSFEGQVVELPEPLQPQRTPSAWAQGQ